MAAKLAMNVLMRLLSEAFISKMLVHGLRAVAENTENKIDDRVVKDIADALGVSSEVSK